MRFQPLILAAGKGTRMGGDLPKVLVPVLGRPLITHLLERVAQAGFPSPALVVGYRQEEVRTQLGPAYKYVLQEEQRGTGHAVLSAQAALQGTADAFLIMNGDHPLWSPATLRRLADEHARSGAVLSLATVQSDTHPLFTNFGRVLRDEAGQVQAIRERRDCTAEEAAITEVSPSLYCISDQWLWSALARIKTDNAQGEFYLTDLVGIAVADGQPLATVGVEDWQEALGINTPEELREVEEILRARAA